MTTAKKKVTTTTSVECVNWKNHVRAGSKFSKEIEPSMLNDDCLCQSRGVDGLAFVDYSSDYVLSKIAYHIFSKLNLSSYEDYEKLFEKAWVFYQSCEYEMSR